MRQRLVLEGRSGNSGLRLKFQTFIRSSSVAIPKAPLFVQGKFVESETTEYIDVVNPATNKVTLQVPQATQGELEAAVRSAKEAFHCGGAPDNTATAYYVPVSKLTT